MFYRSNQINKMADAPIAPVPLGGADPIAHAAPFVTPAEALGAEMVVIIDALMENNRRMMGVRPHLWCAPTCPCGHRSRARRDDLRATLPVLPAEVGSGLVRHRHDPRHVVGHREADSAVPQNTDIFFSANSHPESIEKNAPLSVTERH